MNSSKPIALNWEDLEYTLRAETQEEWSHRLKAASPNQFNQLKLILSRFATDGQLRNFFKILSKEMQSKSHLTRLLTNRISHEDVIRWEKKLKQRAPGFFSAKSNYTYAESEQESHKLLHYTLADRDTTRSKTIIGFTGNGGMLMAPIACILATLSTNEYNLIVIRRRYRESYFSDKGKLLDSIYRQLQTTLGDQLENSITLGTSSGGLAAAYSAHALKLPLGVILGARANENTFTATGPVAEAREANDLTFRPNHHGFKQTNLILIAGAKHKEDRESVRLIRNHFQENYRDSSSTKALLFRGCNDHHIPSDLARIGISLEQVLTAILQGESDGLTSYLEKDGASEP